MPTTPTPEQIQYMQEHINDTLVPSMHISNGIMVGAATVSVVMRFMARRMSASGIGKDDICLFVAYSTITVASIYIFGMAFVKYSILFLYARIFPTRRFRYTLWAIGMIVTSWAMAAFFATLFNCYPIDIAWDLSVQGSCIDYGKVILVIGIFNVLLDFAMLPFRACIVSIARLFYASNVLTSYDPTWDDALPGILSGLEICTGIVACCAVTYRPLIERMFVQRESNLRAESQVNLSSPSPPHRVPQEWEMRRMK
ncbi:hypothetical protein BGAL_0418g00100 [Botrytis galanthina]|uniref:Rhodopsin domain-containing protein n=1 Tax=Botrytis galanthina TaxID=278940 RepID=A0A4S8QMM1_9HELO|nr:hypothetical protein BGAL_0418g00100 [Botrytis galanthina]